MWTACLCLSFGCLVAAVLLSVIMGSTGLNRKWGWNLFHVLVAGVFCGTLILFLPVHSGGTVEDLLALWRTALLSVFTSIQVFAAGCEFGQITENMASCPEGLVPLYTAWSATLYVLAPVFTFGFILSLFRNLTAYLRYLSVCFRDVYIFSDLNEGSMALAEDIRKNHPDAAVVFTDVFEENEEQSFELVEQAGKIGAICFKKDILVVNFGRHSARRNLFFFTIGSDETENLNQALKLIERYRNRDNTHIYVFSNKVESELLLTAVDKGRIRVRRINQAQSLINRVLYEDGKTLFDHASPGTDGEKELSAVVVGMGQHGCGMIKALSWFGQMDGYRVRIHGFDQDPMAEEKFTALAPELMDPDYNGVYVPGEAQYFIRIHSGLDVDTASFAEEIMKLKNASYVLVALGSDDANINAAVRLRMLFERVGTHPVIHAIVYNSQQRKALTGIRNYRGQAYDITFIGDLESSFTEKVIIDSELEADALRRHLKWGAEEEFWTYEYNYRSSVASAIHMRARIHCKIPGADKTEEMLTEQERDGIEVLEHRRWNAYMRSEGYVFSGSTDKKSRNDLAKMHHDLVNFADLSEEEKRKDSSVGTF